MNKDKKTIKTVGVLVLDRNSVLLVKHGESAKHLTDTYGLASGRIDEGETEKQAAIRELKEESGLKTKEEFLIEVPEKEYVADIERKGGETERFSLKLFVCIKYSGELKTEFETIPEWRDIKDIPELNLLPNVEKMIEDGKRFIQEEINKENKIKIK